MLDAKFVLADAQAATADAASTNYINFGLAAPYIGEGDAVVLVVTCAEAWTGTGFTSWVFNAQTDDNSSFSSATTILSKTIGTAPTLGQKLWEQPLEWTALEKYFRVYIDITATTSTAGKVNIYLNLAGSGIAAGINAP